LRTAAHGHGVRLRKRLVQTDKKRRRKEASSDDTRGWAPWDTRRSTEEEDASVRFPRRILIISEFRRWSIFSDVKLIKMVQY
jgi:hypothetical protein